ncbi:MAG: hypothetical protein AABX29_00470 [Nanoarchaeota archaeon]|mgnify:CR=1 FL=1
MYQKIFYGMFVLILLSGCANPYQTKINENQLEINAYLIDNTNIGKLNECTQLGSCDGWKCLCDTMVSENDYCERYEDFCVNNVCEEITINYNDVNFMEEHFSNNKYSGCVFVYDKVVEIGGISIREINDEDLTCLSNFRNNMDVPDWHIYTVGYRNERFFDNEGMIIKC